MSCAVKLSRPRVRARSLRRVGSEPLDQEPNQLRGGLIRRARLHSAVIGASQEATTPTPGPERRVRMPPVKAAFF
jgi:hypothetical protein